MSHYDEAAFDLGAANNISSPALPASTKDIGGDADPYALHLHNPEIVEGCRAIELTQGYFAVVSAIDYERVVMHKWCAFRTKGKVYGVRKRKKYERGQGLPLTIYMHRFIVGINVDSWVVDHINGKGLCNNRTNLRAVTKAENNGCTRRNCEGTSKYRGVYIYPQRLIRKHRIKKPIVARVTVKGERRRVGSWPLGEENERVAARARDEMLLELLGKDVLFEVVSDTLNFPNEFRSRFETGHVGHDIPF